VLFFSGYAEDGLEFDAPEVPGRHYLKKPFTSEQLTAAVDLLLPLRSEDPA
jgi:two-component SAPR family response regulator